MAGIAAGDAQGVNGVAPGANILAIQAASPDLCDDQVNVCVTFYESGDCA